jgi:hypothetical protein
VPEAVITEAVKHFRADLEEAASSLAIAKRRTGRVLPSRDLDDAVDIDQEVAAYEEYLRATLTVAGTSFDYPTVDTAELSRKAIMRQKPFKADGSGYVDALVWIVDARYDPGAGQLSGFEVTSAEFVRT